MSLTRGIQKTKTKQTQAHRYRKQAGGWRRVAGKKTGEGGQEAEMQRDRVNRPGVAHTQGRRQLHLLWWSRATHVCTGQTTVCTHVIRYSPPNTLQLKREKIHACGDLCTAACRSFLYNTHRPGGAQRAINKQRLHGVLPTPWKSAEQQKGKDSRCPRQGWAWKTHAKGGGQAESVRAQF